MNTTLEDAEAATGGHRRPDLENEDYSPEDAQAAPGGRMWKMITTLEDAQAAPGGQI